MKILGKLTIASLVAASFSTTPVLAQSQQFVTIGTGGVTGVYYFITNTRTTFKIIKGRSCTRRIKCMRETTPSVADNADITAKLHRMISFDPDEIIGNVDYRRHPAQFSLIEFRRKNPEERDTGITGITLKTKCLTGQTITEVVDLILTYCPVVTDHESV